MVVHNAYGYGLFTGGLGFHQGAERLGCTVVPISGGVTARQVQFLHDLGAQVLAATPSYALSIADAIDAAGVPRSELKLEVGMFGAEPWTEEMRRELERRLGLTALNIYGLSEIIGPGVSSECREGRRGLHIQEDHFLPEVVDPDTGEPLPPGAEGELVLTTLTKEALPLVRYRTGDISALDPSPCVCGRTLVRMSKVFGRRDDMLVIRGVNVYPSEVEAVLVAEPAVAPHYLLVVDRTRAMPELVVVCELDAGRALCQETEQAERDRVGGDVGEALRQRLGLATEVHVLPPGTIPRVEAGKAVRVAERTAERDPTAGLLG
jgi:phenylacetate-CoA ligase